ncbi:hypothetical protein BGZ74_001670, partial [Mortierella antarctica]
MSDKNKVLPEIFDIIFTHLDTTSLLNAILVCRTWHDNAWHRLWRHLHHPTLSATFFDQLAKHGHRVQSLSLLLDSDLGSHGVVPMELTRVLRHTPRLASLTLRLSHSGPQETVTSLLRVIQGLLGPNRPTHNNNTTNNDVLTKLDLDIGPITHEDAAWFFPTFQNALTDLTLSGSVSTSALQLMIRTLPGLHALATHERQSQFLDDDDDDDDHDVQEGFTDEILTDLGKTLPQLTHWAMTGNDHVTHAGLSSFGDACRGLTSLDLTSCLSVGDLGIERLVDKSALLTHVRLDHTLSGDGVLQILATPSRAARLRVLRVAGSMGVTAFGLHHVVMACVNLEELDISASLHNLLEVFEGPFWRCTRLAILRVGLQLRGRRWRTDDHLITDSERRQMFTQLGRLGRLRELSLDNVGARLQLWEAGRAVIESLTWLERLSLQQFAYKRKDVIWLMTQLPGLRRLVLTEDDEHTDLINDLKDINRRLVVVVLEEVAADDALDNSNSDSDDDDAFFYNPHPMYDFGAATDSESESDVVHEEDGEDGLDQSDEDEVPATFAGHFLHHPVSMDTDDESVEESDEEQSEVYLEEHSASDNSICDNHSDDDEETTRYAHSTFSLYRSPYMSEDSQASDSLDESDDADGNIIGHSYSGFGAYRSFDEDDEENSESDQDDVSSSGQEDSEEVSEEEEIEDSENDEEEEQEESEAEEYESHYDSDETPPPPYESDCSVDSSDQDDFDEEEEGVVCSDVSVEESDQSMPEESDVDVSEEEEKEEDEEDVDEEEDLDEEEEVEEEEEHYEEEDEIDAGDYDDEPGEEYFDEEGEIDAGDYDDEPV